MLSPSPLEPRNGHSAVWTGRELLVWGGGDMGPKRGPHDRREPAGYSYDPTTRKKTQLVAELFADGAAYEPAAERWTHMRGSPLRARSGHAALWTGKEMIVWGGFHLHEGALSDGAAYDPRSRSWRRIAESPFREPPAATVVWTGREMLVWGGFDHDAERPAQGAVYVPAADRWRRIAPFPLATRQWHTAVGPATR